MAPRKIGHSEVPAVSGRPEAGGRKPPEDVNSCRKNFYVQHWNFVVLYKSECSCQVINGQMGMNRTRRRFPDSGARKSPVQRKETS